MNVAESGELITAVGQVLRDLREEFQSQVKTLSKSGESKATQGKLTKALAEVDRVSAEVARLDSALPEKEVELRTYVDGAVSNVKGLLLSELQMLRDDRLSLEERLTGSVTKFSGMSEGLGRVHDQISTLEASLSAQRTRHTQSLTQVAASVDQIQKKLEELEGDPRLEAMVQRNDLEAELETIRGSMGKMEESVSADMTELQASVQSLRDAEIQASIERVTSSLNGDIEAVRKDLSQAFAERDLVRKDFDGMREAVNTELASLAQRTLAQYTSCPQWERGGAAFKQCAMVRHDGGVWQALKSTQEEPGEGEDWVLVLNGLKSTSLDMVPEKAATMRLTLSFAGGQETATEFALPMYKFLGTWDAETTNQPLDVVTWKGCRWLALEQVQEEPGDKSEGWALLSMRGARGPKGPEGDPGPPGKPYPMTKIIEEVETARSERGGVPVGNFRGAWEHGTAYVRGDVVSVSHGLRICNQDNDGQVSPVHIGTGVPWDIMLEVGSNP